MGALEDDKVEVRNTVELRSPDGSLQSRHPVRSQLHPHPTRDLVVFHLVDEARFAECALEAGIAPCHLQLLEPTAGALLQVHGHRTTTTLTRGGLGPDAELETPMPPLVTQGHFLGRNDAQAFARTEPKCELGMCGAPVELLGDGASGLRGCIGMVEGVVAAAASDNSASGGDGDTPASSKRRRATELLRDAAVFIHASELAAFVHQVEARLMSGPGQGALY